MAPVVLLAAALAGCMGAPHASDGITGAAPAPPSARFVVLGDAGTGTADQYAVAAAIAKACAGLATLASDGLVRPGCDFALDLGDNIYESGASSPRDPQFDTKFERPFANLTFPFWMVLGNHDNSQDPAGVGAGAGFGVWYQSGNNEVAYANRTDRASTKWTMPGRYYTFQAGPVGFVALDTNTMLFDEVPFPPDQQAALMAQSKWIDGAFQGLAGPWRIAMGHHPYLSNGPHGNAGAYDGREGAPGLSGDRLKAFFEAHVCGKAQLYLSGHDHDLEWLEPTPSCGATEFIVSGGGGASTYPLGTADPARFQQQTLGFWWMEATPTHLRAVAYDAGGKELFRRELHTPR